MHDQHQLWVAATDHAAIQEQWAEAQQMHADEWQQPDEAEEWQQPDDGQQYAAGWQQHEQEHAEAEQQHAEAEQHHAEQHEQAEQAEAEWLGMQMGAAERAADIEAERMSAQQHGSLSQHSKKNRQGHVFRGCFSIAVVLHMSLGDVFRRCKDLDYIFYIIYNMC